MTLIERKQRELQQRAASLDKEIEGWKGRPLDPADTTFRKHNSQILAFERALAKARAGVAQSIKPGAFDLAVARESAKVLLGAFRIWEFLRSKLLQRTELKRLPFLSLADEYAWLCYQPVYQRGLKEPPLVFLNGGYSPFILTRHKRFQAEVVPQELIVDRTLHQAMASLPFPVIGVPWYQVTSLADLTVLGHEVGHSVEVDFGISSRLDDAIKVAVPDLYRQKRWLAWRSEIFADLYGCVCGGPAFVSALADFLSGEDLADTPPEYPAPDLRFTYNLAVLSQEKHDVEPLRAAWRQTYAGGCAIFKQEADDVARKLCEIVKTEKVVAFDPAMDTAARKLAREVIVDNNQVQGQFDLRILAAAYRHGHDLALEQSAEKLERLAKIQARMLAILGSDLRSGEKARNLNANGLDAQADDWLTQLKKTAPANPAI